MCKTSVKLIKRSIGLACWQLHTAQIHPRLTARQARCSATPAQVEAGRVPEQRPLRMPPQVELPDRRHQVLAQAYGAAGVAAQLPGGRGLGRGLGPICAAPPVGLEPTTDRLEGCCSIL